jgi:hypothetical protein
VTRVAILLVLTWRLTKFDSMERFVNKVNHNNV